MDYLPNPLNLMSQCLCLPDPLNLMSQRLCLPDPLNLMSRGCPTESHLTMVRLLSVALCSIEWVILNDHSQIPSA